MKALFLIFHGLEAYNGISKKIRYQVDAFKICGIDMQLCYVNIGENGLQTRMVDDQVIEIFDQSFQGKIKKWADYSTLLQYINQHKIEFVYMRSYHNANPFLIAFVKKLKNLGIKVVQEIPTYPYDQEYRGASKTMKIQHALDKCFRKKLAKYLFRIVTFSDHKKIFGTPTINISNGIDFDAIKMKENVKAKNSDKLNLISVAEIHSWHGFDRLIAGLIEYYKTPRQVKVFYDIVGYGVVTVIDKLKKTVNENNLQEYVTFYGSQFGEGLDILFDKADMGIASLARHRSNIIHIKTLKNREYAARGIPFAYSEIDDDFEQMPYILKIPMDETPVNIGSLIEFYQSVHLSPNEIRSSIAHLSWEMQMKKVLDVVTQEITE